MIYFQEKRIFPLEEPVHIFGHKNQLAEKNSSFHKKGHFYNILTYYFPVTKCLKSCTSALRNVKFIGA
jgi:hypothetical protein